jgi:hypothetical protein
VLDVIKGKACFVVGTVYMDMPLKPNVLEDIGRDVSSNVLCPSLSADNFLEALPSCPSTTRKNPFSG